MAIAETVKNYLTQKTVDYTLLSHSHTGSSHESAEAADSFKNLLSGIRHGHYCHND
jgi:hypothetical protein